MTLASNETALTSLAVDERLAGLTALITGSTSGIGEAIARVVAASGAEILVTGRDLDRANQVVATIVRSGGRARALCVDLSAPPEDLRDFARSAKQALGGRVDILVNNAGIYPAGPTEHVSDAQLEAVLSVNVRAPHVLVGALAPAMASRSSGAIVNIGSWMARVGVPYMALYPASKAALEQLTRAWAAEYGPRGVRVNTVAPGATATPGNSAAADALKEMTKSTVAGRPVRPIDIGHAVRFVVSQDASFLPGSTIDVDGGITHSRLG